MELVNASLSFEILVGCFYFIGCLEKSLIYKKFEKRPLFNWSFIT